jgi:hypothetical protein
MTVFLHQENATEGRISTLEEQHIETNQTINDLNNMSNVYGDTLDSIMFDILPNLNN